MPQDGANIIPPAPESIQYDHKAQLLQSTLSVKSAVLTIGG